MVIFKPGPVLGTTRPNPLTLTTALQSRYYDPCHRGRHWSPDRQSKFPEATELVHQRLTPGFKPELLHSTPPTAWAPSLAPSGHSAHVGFLSLLLNIPLAEDSAFSESSLPRSTGFLLQFKDPSKPKDGAQLASALHYLTAPPSIPIPGPPLSHQHLCQLPENSGDLNLDPVLC